MDKPNRNELIDGWHCSIGQYPYEGVRTATNRTGNCTLTFGPDMKLNIDGTCDGLYDNVPSKVLDWLLTKRDYFIWEEGGDFREDFGDNKFHPEDKWQDHNPYK